MQRFLAWVRKQDPDPRQDAGGEGIAAWAGPKG
jgi:hypothetical protein